MSETSASIERRKPRIDGKVKQDSQDRFLSTRTAGILLHPTSFPGRFGCGDLGPAAYEFVDFASSAGCSCWQLLPLGPTGFGGSPYQCTSAFAGSPLLISIDLLVQEGLVDAAERSRRICSSEDKADFGAASRIRHELLGQAFQRFAREVESTRRASFEAFKADHSWWLDDFVLYAALKDEHGGRPWYEWPRGLARREPALLTEAAHRLREPCEYHRFVQFMFLKQWRALRRHAAIREISIIGDIPIFPSLDSADVWAHSSIFKLDENGRPTAVAGVPPDYFSKTGQLWGNPLYRWEALAESEYAWWVQRFQHLLSLVDLVRLDHFRGFVAAWEVPAGETTAVKGSWKPGPGISLFQAVRQRLGHLPLIAEDLGVITPEVENLKAELKLPGMTILQFAFDSDAWNPHLPHNHTRECVVYTGTHDNDTTKGFYEKADPRVVKRTMDYVGKSSLEVPWDLIRLAYASVANTCIVPLQDVLALGSDARMNLPGTEQGNWRWRYGADALEGSPRAMLRDLAETYGRASNS